VKKKNGEWRLYVDHRILNAYYIKNKFPLPIVEELFEELLGAKWFTTLDLRSGFHQILVQEEDQHKTVFQTYFGHFEYKSHALWVNWGPCYLIGHNEPYTSSLVKKMCGGVY
jgi:hypothetical protein